MLKNVLRSELKVAVRMAKGPRKPRVSAKGKGRKAVARAKPKTPQERADEMLAKVLHDPGGGAKVPRKQKETEPAD
jgi:type III secretion system FlhB-like substrate exporter